MVREIRLKLLAATVAVLAIVTVTFGVEEHYRVLTQSSVIGVFLIGVLANHGYS
jgi:hypothetical protein